jgi:hypothetical protein
MIGGSLPRRIRVASVRPRSAQPRGALIRACCGALIELVIASATGTSRTCYFLATHRLVMGGIADPLSYSTQGVQWGYSPIQFESMREAAA